MNRTNLAALALALVVGFAFAQDKSQEPTATSLIEQGKFAEEQERDFKKAEGLYGNALTAALAAKDAAGAAAANAALTRVKARAAGIQAVNPEDENDPMICRLADRMDTIARSADGAQVVDAAYDDVAMYGAIAVPWLEKLIQGPIRLCKQELKSEPPRIIRAIAMMTGPEAGAALERLLSSPDPIARRAVAKFADPLRHREILLRALKDPAQAVRDQAIQNLSSSTDTSLFEVMIAAARTGNQDAIDWIRVQRPETLLSDASNRSLSLSYRCNALNELRGSNHYRPDQAAIDAMLALARPPNEDTLRRSAMALLYKGVSENWKPIQPDLGRRIEDALVSGPDGIPPEWILNTLLIIGGPRSLVPILERTPPEDLGGTLAPVTRILSHSGSADFSTVVAAFAKTSPPLRNSQGQLLDTLHGMLRGWLESMVNGDISSAEIARGAAALDPGLRRIYIDRVVIPWIQTKIQIGPTNARAPAIDPSFVKLVRDLALEASPNYSETIALTLGATGEASNLPDLLKLAPAGEMGSTLSMAIKRIVGDDPARVKSLLELLLANKSITAPQIPQILRATVGARPPAEMLALANGFWGKANSEKLMTLVSGSVPGPEGSAFLLAHYAELDASASETRINVIERFGQELYEPAKGLIGASLRDPNSRVRQQASSVFERFKQQQLIVDNFNEWMKSDNQGRQTISELEKLLDSPNTDVVVGAVKVLAAMKSRTSYPKLIQLLDKHANDEAIKTAVKRAIDALGTDEGSSTPATPPAPNPSKSDK